MKLKMLNLELTWPEQVSLKDLRKWIRDQISDHGYPLRWAVTSIETISRTEDRKLKIEAVVILSKPEELEGLAP